VFPFVKLIESFLHKVKQLSRGKANTLGLWVAQPPACRFRRRAGNNREMCDYLMLK
jgi:hypothetical protein